MAIIPHEIVQQILACLPVISILRFKCVCKEWKQLFESWDFITSHYIRAMQLHRHYSSNASLILVQDSYLYMLPDPTATCQLIELTLPPYFQRNNATIEVIGSCNGFVCVACDLGLNHSQYFLFNPYFHGCYRIIPDVRNHLSGDALTQVCYRFVSGFGFDSHGNDFKIVYAFYLNYSDIVLVSVFSLTSGLWKHVEPLPFRLQPYSWVYTQAVELNNSLHWCGDFWYKSMIVTFDLCAEQWGQIECPDIKNHYFVEDISVYSGCLGILIAPTEYSNASTELWVMKEYGVNESWTKVLTLPLQTLFLLYSPLRRQVLLQNVHSIGWFDVDEENGSVTDNEWCEFEIGNEACTALCFYGTLVSLPSSTIMSAIIKGE